MSMFLRGKGHRSGFMILKPLEFLPHSQLSTAMGFRVQLFTVIKHEHLFISQFVGHGKSIRAGWVGLERNFARAQTFTTGCRSIKDAAVSRNFGASSAQEYMVVSSYTGSLMQTPKYCKYILIIGTPKIGIPNLWKPRSFSPAQNHLFLGNPQLLAALRASPNGARCVPFQRLEFLGDAVLLVRLPVRTPGLPGL